MNELKKTIFYEMLAMSGRVFIVVKYSDRVIIGARGFTPEEKKNGIVLVFNSDMNFAWDEYGITAVLAFGTQPQKCYIPADDIVVINSPELNAQFVAVPEPSEGDAGKGKEQRETENHEQDEDAGDSRVVRVDFTKKRDRRPGPQDS